MVVLSFSLWQRLFHGDPNVIGRIVHVGNMPQTIIGVLPKEFRFPNENALRAFRSQQTISSAPAPELFQPVVFSLSEISWGGEFGNWVAIGRLKPGVNIKRAQAEKSVPYKTA